MRCIKANRTCSGYEVHGTAQFRQYGPQDKSQVTTFSSIARKCTLPKRAPIPGTEDALPDDRIPVETTDAQSNMFSLRAFCYDFCVVPTNTHLSQGFLPRIERMVQVLGPKSDLAKACQAVSFVSHADLLNRPAIKGKSAAFYQELLGSLARAIENSATEPTMEAKSIAMLLGLYQIMTASPENHGAHEIHAKGLAALLRVDHSPGNDFSNRPPSLLKHFHLDTAFSLPSLRGPSGTLGHLLAEVESLYSRSELLEGGNDVSEVMEDAMALFSKFSEWQDTRTFDFRPTTAGRVRSRDDTDPPTAGFWPGNIDTYFDLYVAGIWNIFRTARLLLITIITRLSQQLEDNRRPEYLGEAQKIFQDIAASVPYHLVDNLPVFTSEISETTEVTDVGKHLGGLLLMHPLYVVTKMRCLGEAQRRYARDCLLWIGSNMGVGQAIVLATEPHIDREYLLSGFVIIWSGILS